MKTISYLAPARRALRKMQRETAQRILVKIEAYAADPASQANNAKALRGHDGIRLRVGDYRVIMNDRGDVLDIIDVGHRREVC
jgi:mRNA interferase RelE/StbE